MRSSFIWTDEVKYKKHSIFYWGISFLSYVNSFLVCTSDMILTLCTMILMGVSHKQVKSLDWRCDLYNPFLIPPVPLFEKFVPHQILAFRLALILQDSNLIEGCIKMLRAFLLIQYKDIWFFKNYSLLV